MELGPISTYTFSLFADVETEAQTPVTYSIWCGCESQPLSALLLQNILPGFACHLPDSALMENQVAADQLVRGQGKTHSPATQLP